MTLFTLDVITIVFADYWLFESLGLSSRSSGRTSAWAPQLYVAAFVLFARRDRASRRYLHDVDPRDAALRRQDGVPRRPRSRRTWRRTQLLRISCSAAAGFAFDKTDPVFGMDIGFYAFNLPNLWIAWRYLTWAAFLFLCFSIACANAARARNPVRASALAPARPRRPQRHAVDPRSRGLSSGSWPRSASG